jgi:hypothetical protein
MPGLNDLVRVDIALATSAVSEAGFGIPLIISASTSATWTTAELTRTYASASEVDDDFATTTPEYKAAAVMFAQDPAPESIVIGRCLSTAKPIMTYTVTVLSGINGQVYSFYLNDTLITFTAANTSTTDIATGLAAAVTTAAISGISAGAASAVVTITGTAGTYVYPKLRNEDGVSWGPDGYGLLAMAATTADPSTSMATQLASIKNENDEWFAICNPYVGNPIGLIIAAYAEAQKKLYIQADPSTITITQAVGAGTDLADDLKTLGYAWSAVIYSEDPEEFADAAWYGNRLPTSPGSETWAFADLVGVTPSRLTSTHKTNLDAKHCNYFYAPGGQRITLDGTTADGGYIDIIRLVALIESRIQARVVTKLVNASPGKIPGNDAGIQIIYGEVFGVLEGLRTQPAPALESFTIVKPRQADRSTADKAVRLLTGMSFTAIPTSAIHRVIPINGTVTL